MNQREQLSPSLTHLVDAFENTEGITASKAAEILEEIPVTADDLLPWADFDHPLADSYGRKLVWDGGFFEVMVMSWNPGDMAAIHDHGYTQWGAVRMFGDAEHAIFRVEGDRLITTDRRVFSDGTVVKVNNGLTHQMGNVGSTPFLSLHVYGCYEREGGVTSDARLYELDEGLIQRTNGGVFFDLPSEDVVRTEPGPEPDYTTQLRHRVELLRRLLAKNESLAKGSFQSPREVDLASAIFDTDSLLAAERELHAAARGDSSEGVLVSRPCAVAEDLQAAARLRSDLIRAGLAGDYPAETADRLEKIATIEDPVGVVEAYFEIATSHSLALDGTT